MNKWSIHKEQFTVFLNESAVHQQIEFNQDSYLEYISLKKKKHFSILIKYLIAGVVHPKMQILSIFTLLKP